MGRMVEGAAAFRARSEGTSGATARLDVTTSFLSHWSDIAIERTAAAREARADALTAQANGCPTGDARQRELHAAMVAIVAAALAIDALYGEVRDDAGVPPELRAAWEENGTARERRILETLEHGFRVGREAARWSGGLRWLFGLRDLAVHYEARVREPKPHPLGGYPAVERVDYAVESAERAVGLLLDVLATCVERPKPRTAAWAGRLKENVDRLVGSRSSSPDGR